MIDLDPHALEIVKRLLDEHMPEVEVRVFGSRVNATSRKYSDLDLALVAAEAVPPGRIEALKDAFSASDLPFQVDVLDWRAISPSFRAVIEQKFDVIHAPRADKDHAFGG